MLDSQTLQQKCACVLPLMYATGIGVKLNIQMASHPLNFCGILYYAHVAVIVLAGHTCRHLEGTWSTKPSFDIKCLSVLASENSDPAALVQKRVTRIESSKSTFCFVVRSWKSE